MTMDIYESLILFTVDICFQNAYSEKTNAFVAYVSGDAST